MTEQTTHETLSAAYDQGVEEGIRQERERVREALLEYSSAKVAAMELPYYPEDIENGNIPMAREVISRLIDHIGLGAVTTEESEKCTSS